MLDGWLNLEYGCLVSRSLSSTSLAKAIASESNEGLSNANSAWIAGFNPKTKQSNNASGFIRAGDGGMDKGVVLVGDWVEVDATTWMSWVIRTARSAIAVLMTTPMTTLEHSGTTLGGPTSATLVNPKPPHRPKSPLPTSETTLPVADQSDTMSTEQLVAPLRRSHR
nr:hypothetical protein Iba_chr14dCG1970 [Ipomoea batatas]